MSQISLCGCCCRLGERSRRFRRYRRPSQGDGERRVCRKFSPFAGPFPCGHASCQLFNVLEVPERPRFWGLLGWSRFYGAGTKGVHAVSLYPPLSGPPPKGDCSKGISGADSAFVASVKPRLTDERKSRSRHARSHATAIRGIEADAHPLLKVCRCRGCRGACRGVPTVLCVVRQSSVAASACGERRGARVSTAPGEVCPEHDCLHGGWDCGVVRRDARSVNACAFHVG